MDTDPFLVVLIQAKFLQHTGCPMQCWHSWACLQLSAMQQRTLLLLMGNNLSGFYEVMKHIMENNYISVS